MNILATQYSLDKRALEIYVAGCNGSPHCSSCHNPESWDFEKGEPFDNDYLQKITQKVIEFDELIENVMIMGGEPLDQDHTELFFLLWNLYVLTTIGTETEKKLWLFTRYDLQDIPDHIKSFCDFIKCGRYMEELKTEDNIQYGIKLATSNQKIYVKGIDF